MKIEQGRAGTLRFFSNPMPDDPEMTAQSLDLRLGSRLERIRMAAEEAPSEDDL